jgi:hypothetical protein
MSSHRTQCRHRAVLWWSQSHKRLVGNKAHFTHSHLHFYSFLDGVNVAKAISLKESSRTLVLSESFLLSFIRVTLTTNLPPQVSFKMWHKRQTKSPGTEQQQQPFSLSLLASCNSMDLRRGSQVAVDRVLKLLAAHTKIMTTAAEIAQVASHYSLDKWCSTYRRNKWIGYRLRRELRPVQRSRELFNL